MAKKLKELLSETLFFSAAEDPVVLPTVDKSEILFISKTWEYKLEAISKPVVRNLSNVFVKNLGLNLFPTYCGDNGKSAVCSSITWGEDVKIRCIVKNFGPDIHEYKLPLDSKFLIAFCKAEKGKIPVRQSAYWQGDVLTSLAASFQLVYGYSLAQAGGVRPFEPEETKADDFSDFNSDAQSTGIGSSLASIAGIMVLPSLRGTKAVQKIYLSRARIIVCVSLVCCNPSICDPFGIVYGARIFPLTMVKANNAIVKIEKLTTETIIQRPAFPDIPQPYFFTDGNKLGDHWWDKTSNAIKPNSWHTWADMFGYYNLKPKPGQDFKMVDTSRKNIRNIENIRKKLFHDPFPNPIPPGTYLTTNLVKYPRQGDYDNLHIAPLMNFSTFMAPICQHNCLHMHVRWGATVEEIFQFKNLAYESHNKIRSVFKAFKILEEEFEESRLTSKHWFRGWSEDYGPYQEWGLPLVPPDQDIILHMIDRGYIYKAIITNSARTHHWQIIFHHGTYYALALRDDKIRIFLGTDNVDESYYHKLRFSSDGYPWLKEGVPQDEETLRKF